MLSLEAKSTCLKSGLFRTLDDETLSAIAGRMGERDFAAGETLFVAGEPGDEIFVIVEGEIEIFVGEHIIAVLGPGQLFGEMAVLGGGRRTAGGRARGEAKLLFLKEKALKILIQQLPGLAFAIFRVLIDRLDEANQANRFLSAPPPPVGMATVVSGPLTGEAYPIHHRRTLVGRSQHSTADVLRLTFPVEDEALCDDHAVLTIGEEGVFVEPRDGEVTVNGEAIAECMALTVDDRVGLADLEIQVAPTEG